MFDPVALLLVIILALILLCACVYYVTSRRRIEDVPQPPLWPLLGNANLFLNASPPEFLVILKDLLQKYGKRFQVALGLDVVFFTADVKDFEVK